LRVGHKASYHTPLKKIPQRVKLMEEEQEEEEGDSSKQCVFRCWSSGLSFFQRY
jgi:hypothetical protein